MNQILVTEKLYVTPELRRKKKIYKSSFIISIFLVITLFSVYAYAEYDRNKNEEISQYILSDMVKEEEEQQKQEINKTIQEQVSEQIKEIFKDL